MPKCKECGKKVPKRYITSHKNFHKAKLVDEIINKIRNLGRKDATTK